MKFIFETNLPKGPFESIGIADWQDWRWQLKNSLKTQESFSQLYDLTDSEKKGFESAKGIFQIRSTPYYVGLGSKTVWQDPIRLIQTPDYKEATSGTQQMLDPLAETKNSVTPRLIHRYPDRVVFLVTDFCSVYCRFCTRKRFTATNQAFLSGEEYESSLNYLRSHTGIREVILSGGDPLTLSDDILSSLLADLRKIEHIEIIRIGSRMPVVNPFRFTDNLIAILKQNIPVYLMTHFNHPKELTLEAKTHLEKVVDAGIPILNQMVLLNGINNHAAIVQALSRRLLYLRIKPYYMFQCDPSMGTDHLRTSIEDSLEIQNELWGNLSGLAMPNFSVDIPGGGGKASLVPSFLTEKLNQTWKFKGFDGIEANYVDPLKSEIRKPVDAENYKEEWQSLKDAKILSPKFFQA